MKNKLMNNFSLTEAGAKSLIKASIYSLLMNIVLMLPITLVLSFICDGLNWIWRKKPMMSIYTYIVLIVIVVALIIVVGYLQYTTLFVSTYQESERLRIRIANSLKNQPLSYFFTHDIADSTGTIMQDTNDIEQAISHAIPQTIGITCFITMMVVGLLMMNIKLGLAIFLPIPITLIILLLSKKHQIKMSTEYFVHQRKMSDAVQTHIEYQTEIREFNLQEQSENKLLTMIDEDEKVHLITDIKQSLPIVFSSSVLKLGLGLTLLVGAGLLQNSEITLFQFLAAVLASSRIYDPLQGLYENIAQLFFLDSRVKRIQSLKIDELNYDDIKFKNYDIEFDDVSFSYFNNREVLSNVSFKAKQNKVTAIIGPSGSGKTTCTRLIAGFYDLTQGKITIGGQDIKNISSEDLLEHISIIFQDVMLFNQTVFENIKLGKPTATDEEVYLAAKLANIDEFVRELPNGYNTNIGENGCQLSGGQRQRISIARAILKNAPIILLDEITASVDIENEHAIQAGLKNLLNNKTVIVIAHRMKLIENVDEIILMNKGQVEAIGTYDELIVQSKLFQTMNLAAENTKRFNF